MATQQKTPPMIRWIRTAMRSLHIPAFGLVMGAWWLGQTEQAMGWPMTASALTGLLLGGLFFFQSQVWLLELRGVVMAVKLLALAALPHLGTEGGLWLLFVVAFIASMVSHMPGRYRHFRVDAWLRGRPQPT